jgi:hypothetical protein
MLACEPGIVRRRPDGRPARQNAFVIDGRWPDFFEVGAPRAGTTSLWDDLDRHPQIFMSPLKEPHFFCSYKPDFVPTVSDEDDYLRLFADARPGQLRGEASPSYLRDTQAPTAIARVRPDARIVVMLRDPVARAYSEYWHRVRYGRQPRPFAEVIRAALDSPQRPTLGSRYLATGLYADGVERYLAGSERPPPAGGLLRAGGPCARAAAGAPGAVGLAFEQRSTLTSSPAACRFGP